MRVYIGKSFFTRITYIATLQNFKNEYVAKRARKIEYCIYHSYQYSTTEGSLYTPRYAADWKVIGTLLGLPSGELQSWLSY